jgi:hypothetical protein
VARIAYVIVYIPADTLSWVTRVRRIGPRSAWSLLWTLIAGFKPRRFAVVAFDGVVLGDLSTPCEIFGRALRGFRQTAELSLG